MMAANRSAGLLRMVALLTVGGAVDGLESPLGFWPSFGWPSCGALLLFALFALFVRRRFARIFVFIVVFPPTWRLMLRSPIASPSLPALPAISCWSFARRCVSSPLRTGFHVLSKRINRSTSCKLLLSLLPLELICLAVGLEGAARAVHQFVLQIGLFVCRGRQSLVFEERNDRLEAMRQILLATLGIVSAAAWPAFRSATG